MRRKKRKKNSIADRLKEVIALRPWFRNRDLSLNAKKKGRLRLLRKRMERATGYKPSLEVINRWLTGAGIPSPKNVERLAITLEVDESWLTFG